jgi:4-hydroxy-3-polyprenylbenzoate decarboxylase
MAQFDRSTALGVTGASGAAYAFRLLECLLEADHRVYLMLSQPAQVVIGMETDLHLPGRAGEIQRYLGERYGAKPDQLRVLGRDQWTAPVASGSSVPDAMVVCPCTTGTLAAIACGASRSLLERAADVVLKEQGKLILVVRETPLSEIHLRHMVSLAGMGVVILPASPGFYHRPKAVSDLVDFVVARTLDHLGVVHTLLPRWAEQD